MTLDLDPIKALEAAATPGPWKAWIEGRDHWGGDTIISRFEDDLYVHGATDADLDFIAAARSDVPALVAEVERLRERVEFLETVLAKDGAVTAGDDETTDDLALGGIIEDQLRAMGLKHANLAGAPPVEMRVSWEAPDVPIVLAVTIFSTDDEGRRISLPDHESRAMKEVRLFLIEPDWTLRPIEYALTSWEVLEDE